MAGTVARLSEAQHRQRREAPLTHGATSEAQIRPVARNHRRRVLRQLGLSARELDPVGRGYLDLYARTLAKLDLLDAYFGEHGFLDAEGEPAGGAKVYVALANSAQRALARLERHVETSRDDPRDALAAYLAEGAEDEADAAA